MLNILLRYFLVSALFILSINVNAQVISDTLKVVVNGIEYYNYKVEKGIGIYRIATNFGVSQDEILKANPTAASGLVEGQLLLIPIQQSNKSQGQIIHTVAPSETLYSISQKYGVSIQVLREQNSIVDDNIQPGTKLVISNSTGSSDQGTFEYKSDTNSKYHKVSANESLTSIANLYGVTVESIENDNPGVFDTGLKVGTILLIKPAIKQATVVTANNQSSSNFQAWEPKPIHFYILSKGDDLGSIAQKFQVSLVELQKINELIAPAEMVSGTLIAIPVNPATRPELLNSDWYIIHVVQKKETIYGISRTYGVSNELFKLFNSESALLSLKKGQHLILPSNKWIEASKRFSQLKKVEPVNNISSKVTTSCNDYNYFANRDRLNIVLLLPFDVKKNLNSNSSVTEGINSTGGLVKNEQDLNGRSKAAIEFLQGVLLSINHLKEKGVNIKLSTFDTGDENTNLTPLLAKSELKEANLIIGPALPQHIKTVSEFASTNKIKMVLPWGASSNLVTSNPNVFAVTTNDSVQTDKMARYLVTKSAQSNLILVGSYSNSLVQNKLAIAIKQLIANEYSGLNITLKELAYSSGDIAGLSSKFSKDKNNIVVVPSENEVFVGQVLIGLESVANRNLFSMEVYGLSEWLKFQTVDAESFHKMNGRIFTSHSIDYETDVAKRFVSDFRLYYMSEPVAFSPLFMPNVSGTAYNRYGAFGYDVASYFINSLVKYGPSFQNCIVKSGSTKMVQSVFNFKRTTNWGGFCNCGLFLVQFNKDLTTTRIAVE